MRLMSAALSGLLLVGLANAQPRYIGAEKCAKMCHKAVNKGEQLKVWKESKHAQAYADLATPAALETAKKAGITGDPQKAEKCLKCHVTAYGVPAAQIDSTFSIKDGVQCEACHGPGSDYAKLKVMKDKKLAAEAGLLTPNEKTCVKCHNSESPMFKEFVYADMYKKIAHPVPKQADSSAVK